MPVSKTTDYEMFSLLEYNKDINRLTIEKLKKSIRFRNLLEYRPILVSEGLEIIDGQHRFEAAKELQVPIYYTVQSNNKPEDVYILNINQKIWTKEDFLKYFCKTGNSHYCRLKSFMKEHKLNLSCALTALNQNLGGYDSQLFKEGKFKFPDTEKEQECLEVLKNVQESIQYIKEKTEGEKSYLNGVFVQRSLIYFFNLKSFEYETFKTKLKYRLDLIRPCARLRDYIEIFITIYNWKNKNPINEYEMD